MNNRDLKHLSQALPACPDVMGREKYHNSAVLVPFVFLGNEYHFLFQRRTPHIRQGKEICFPGGRFEADKDSNYQDTAIRETMEELGIGREKIKIMGRLDTLVAPMGAVIDPFVARLNITSIDELIPSIDEVDEVFTFPVSLFKNQHVKEYHVRLEMHPSVFDKNGRETVLLPVKELGLPETYHQPWHGRPHRILVYPTSKGPVWGITAEIVSEIIKLLS